MLMDVRKQSSITVRPATLKRRRPGSRAPKLQSSHCYAAIFAALPSMTTFLAVVMGIARGFIASGTTRKRSTCRSPFSRFRALDLDVVSELELAFEIPLGNALVD